MRKLNFEVILHSKFKGNLYRPNIKQKIMRPTPINMITFQKVFRPYTIFLKTYLEKR